jgi:lactoylglutathione lyase
MTKPFRILGLQQIAIGGPDRLKLRRLWVDVFGLGLEGDFTSERENVVEDIAVLGSGPTRVEVDLMQPLDPARKPRVDEPALNHIGLWVDDLPKGGRVDDRTGHALHAGRHTARRGRLRHRVHPSEGQ